MSMFLTRVELADLTGCKRKRNQVAWLVQHGYKFELNAAEEPKVLRTLVEKKMGMSAPKGSKMPCFEPMKEAS